MPGLRSGPGITPSQKADYTAAILRRAGSISVQANGIASRRISFMPALKAHVMLPWTIEIVVVAEASSLAEAKLGEWDIRRPSRQLPRAESSGPERDLEQMDALPAHCDPGDTVQARELLASLLRAARHSLVYLQGPSFPTPSTPSTL
jgi:hypothetical protein